MDGQRQAAGSSDGGALGACAERSRTLLNWDEIAQSGATFVSSLAALDAKERTRVLSEALDWAFNESSLRPPRAYHLCELVVQAIDAYAVQDAELHTLAGVVLGSTAAQRGRPDEAESHLRAVLKQPETPETEPLRIQARSILGGLLADRDPDQASRLLRSASASARRLGHHQLAAAAAVSLGSILKNVKRFEEA